MVLTNNQLKNCFSNIFKNNYKMYSYYILDNFKTTKEYVNVYFTEQQKYHILKYETTDNT